MIDALSARPLRRRSATAKSQAALVLSVFVSLCVLTGVSFWIANSSLMENRSLAWGSMLAVSVAKACLVVMFFMHLWWERAWKYVLTIPALIMGGLLVILLVPDIAMRTESYSQQRRMAAPEVNSNSQSQFQLRGEEES